MYKIIGESSGSVEELNTHACTSSEDEFDAAENIESTGQPQVQVQVDNPLVINLVKMTFASGSQFTQYLIPLWLYF